MNPVFEWSDFGSLLYSVFAIFLIFCIFVHIVILKACILFKDGLEYSSEEEGEDLEDALGKLKQKGKKDLMIVDHNKIEYLPFVKDFYREVPELSRMTDEEVEIYREEMEGIKVKGKNVPRPIKNWPQCGVSSKILDILKKNGYEKPTPIQSQAIPIIMSGKY